MSEPTLPDDTPAAPPGQDVADPAATDVLSEASRRRGLRVMAAGMLAILVGVPSAIASLFVLDPVLRRRRGGEAVFVRVTDLEGVPDDGTPRAFSVRADQLDGWTGQSDVEVGIVFLRKGEDGVLAWNARCPHVGCLIEYKPGEDHFLCPCHSSVFRTDGERENDVSPRAMDTLEAEVREGAVFVAYRDFKYRIAEKVPVS